MQNIKDIFDIAIKLKINGEKFYRTWADKTTNPDATIFFTYLADEEIKHQHIFDNLKSIIKITDAVATQKAEYVVFLKSYINDIIFNIAVLKEEMANTTSLESAVRFGIKRESESILFYEELKHLITPEHHEIIDAVIKEEINHYLKLSDFLKN